MRTAMQNAKYLTNDRLFQMTLFTCAGIFIGWTIHQFFFVGFEAAGIITFSIGLLTFISGFALIEGHKIIFLETETKAKLVGSGAGLVASIPTPKPEPEPEPESEVVESNSDQSQEEGEPCPKCMAPSFVREVNDMICKRCGYFETI